MIKLHKNLEVGVGDVVTAYFDYYGFGRGEVVEITNNSVFIKWSVLDWNRPRAGKVHGYPLGCAWDETWKLDETNVVKRLLKEYDA